MEPTRSRFAASLPVERVVALLRRSRELLRHSMGVVQRSMMAVPRAVLYAHRRKVSSESGFALLVVIVSVAVLAAVVAEFGMNARLEFESAANARDSLKAEYAARSGIQLARMEIKLQRTLFDGLNAKGTNLQITDPLLKGIIDSILNGSDEDRADVSATLGFGGGLTGMGNGKGIERHLDIKAEDGKININCAGGGTGQMPAAMGGAPPIPGAKPTATSTRAGLMYQLLKWVMYPEVYRPLFEKPTADGQYVTADEVARAIIDWSDEDQAKMPENGVGAAGGTEDYHYDQARDPYMAHDSFFDTVEELNMVRGVGDEFFSYFGEMFTVYGRCQVDMRSVNAKTGWPINAAIYRAAYTAAQPDPSKWNPLIINESLVAMNVQHMLQVLESLGFLGFYPDLASIAKGFGDCWKDTQPFIPMAGGASVPCLPRPDPNNLALLARPGRTPPHEVYRIESSGTAKRPGGRTIEVKITAVWDTQHFNQNMNPRSTDPNDRMGAWVYWRME